MAIPTRIRAFGRRNRAVASASESVVSSGQFHELLCKYRLSLLVSSRQGDRLCLITAGEAGVQIADWQIPGPMGLHLRDSMLCVGWSEGIKTFHNVGITDDGSAIYAETTDHRTGPVSIHDIGIDDAGKIWFLNTLYSCLCSLQPGVSFAVEWAPPFTGPLGPYDYCHLNGMYFDEGQARFFTALGVSNLPQGWRDNVLGRGVLLTGEGNLVAEGLSLPHSPIQVGDGVIFVEAGNGRVSHVDPTTLRYAVRCELPGVLRGAALHEGNLFVGSSRVRASSGLVADALAQRIRAIDGCRITVVDGRTGETLGAIELPMLEEISTIIVVPVPGIVFERAPPPGEPFTYIVQA